jgi:hypothetical protein
VLIASFFSPLLSLCIDKINESSYGFRVTAQDAIFSCIAFIFATWNYLFDDSTNILQTTKNIHTILTTCSLVAMIILAVESTERYDIDIFSLKFGDTIHILPLIIIGYNLVVCIYIVLIAGQKDDLLKMLEQITTKYWNNNVVLKKKEKKN